MSDWITPDWPAPRHVRAVSTTRFGGVSGPPWNTLNLGTAAGDRREHVTANRRRLGEAGVPERVAWLKQVHGVDRVDAAEIVDSPRADIAYTGAVGVACAVLHADCLPVLLTDGRQVAAVHAGWRGTAAGVLGQGVGCFDRVGGELYAWLGPAIGGDAYEVGGEVRSAVLDSQPVAEAAFNPNARGRWQFDLTVAARAILTSLGVTRISGGRWCTASDPHRFFSYRRDGQTGRMASLIWLEDR